MIAASAPTYSAEHFAKTTNALKGQVTMLFIAHQIPKGLKLDGVVQIGNPAQGMSGIWISSTMKPKLIKGNRNERRRYDT